MDLTETSDHIQIKIKIPNPRKKPPSSAKAPNQDIKEMLVLYIFKIKVESQNLKQGLPKTTTIYKSISRCQTPIRNLQGPLKTEAPNQDLKDIDTREFVF